MLGIERVPVVKGQNLYDYDPMAIKGIGVTYATTSQGADHTSGLTIRGKIDHLDPKGQVKVSKKAQVNMAGYDTLEACIYAGFGFAAAPDTVSALVNARYGNAYEEDLLQKLGQETIAYEREFNRRVGFTSSDDHLPEWMRREPLPPYNTVFDVGGEDLDRIFEFELDFGV